MTNPIRKLAVVTGASSGIGFELARLCAKSDFDLIVAADENQIRDAAADFMADNVAVTPVVCDLASRDGVKLLLQHILVAGRPVDYLFANAGRGLGGQAFLDQDIQDAMQVAHTNIEGTLYLLHAVARAMRSRGTGRILVTGSAAATSSAYQAVYGATEAFINAFSVALAHELKGTGVTLTCLMPGLTDTAFFERAGMLDTRLGNAHKADAAGVARVGFDAMLKGDTAVIAGWGNKLRTAVGHLAPESLLTQIGGYDAAPERRAGP